MDDLIFLIVCHGSDDSGGSSVFVHSCDELYLVFVCYEMFKFLVAMQEEKKGNVAMARFEELKGLKV